MCIRTRDWRARLGMRGRRQEPFGQSVRCGHVIHMTQRLAATRSLQVNMEEAFGAGGVFGQFSERVPGGLVFGDACHQAVGAREGRSPAERGSSGVEAVAGEVGEVLRSFGLRRPLPFGLTSQH